MKICKSLIFAATALVLSSAAVAKGSANVTWKEPQKYSDLGTDNADKDYFKTKTLGGFEEYFGKLAKSLPDGYQLNIVVSDVDLAGTLKNSATSGPSALRTRIGGYPLYGPKFTLAYTLLDKSGKVVMASSGEIVERSESYGAWLRHPSIRPRDARANEKILLRKWFRREFAEFV